MVRGTVLAVQATGVDVVLDASVPARWPWLLRCNDRFQQGMHFRPELQQPSSAAEATTCGALRELQGT